MATANDVAAYLLKTHFPDGVTHLKMQKLLYYCQVWYAATFARPLFNDRIEAWVNGPVIPGFWSQHRYDYSIRRDNVKGDSSKLGSTETQIADAVHKVYGKYTGVELSRFTHEEDPWREARGDCPPSQRGSNIIDPIAAGRYYKGRATA